MRTLGGFRDRWPESSIDPQTKQSARTTVLITISSGKGRRPFALKYAPFSAVRALDLAKQIPPESNKEFDYSSHK